MFFKNKFGKSYEVKEINAVKVELYYSSQFRFRKLALDE